MDTNKFNTKLSSHSPLAYIEQKTEIITKHSGTIAVVSFGAVERHSHLAPEFGGVAITHENPKVLIGVKYIPWNAKGRHEEHKQIVAYFTEHDGGVGKDYAIYLEKDGYALPSMKERWRREYFEELAENIKKQSMEEAENVKKQFVEEAENVKKDTQTYNGEDLISLDE